MTQAPNSLKHAKNVICSTPIKTHKHVKKTVVQTDTQTDARAHTDAHAQPSTDSRVSTVVTVAVMAGAGVCSWPCGGWVQPAANVGV